MRFINTGLQKYLSNALNYSRLPKSYIAFFCTVQHIVNLFTDDNLFTLQAMKYFETVRYSNIIRSYWTVANA